MENKKKEVEYLVHLLSCALNGKEVRHQEGIDYSTLLSLARKHQVYNIIFPLIKDDLSVPDEYKQKFRDYNLSEISRMLVINNERSEVYDAFDEHGIKYMPLKGLIIKDYYPMESMRQMSDNDILFDIKYRDVVAELMKSMGYKCIATGENSDDYHKPPYCTFEFHRSLFFDEHDFCPKFDNLWENAVKDDERPCMYHMGLEDIYIYSVCHMYKHFTTAGCGIRFLADNYLFLKKEQDKLDWKRIDSFMSEYNISEYEHKCRKLAFDMFDENELDDGELELLETFMNFGIFGNGSIRIANRIKKMSENSNLEQAKKDYILYRLFPPKAKMIADNRILEKKPYLLPLYYILRLFKAMFNGKKTLDEISNIKDVESE